jgi:membrane-associated protease RseP (regulator of RpoE activity)
MLLAVIGILSSVAVAGTQPGTQFNTTPNVYLLQGGGRSYLGVDIQDVTADRVSALKLKEERGVEISAVDQDAPAGKAGLKQHDVILDFNGAPVDSGEQLRRLIRETPPGRTITLGISRDGNPMKISVQLADRGRVVLESTPKVVIPRIQPIPKIDIPGYAFQVQTYSSSLGIQTENLSRQLGEYFGVKDGAGVLVRSVDKGSAAEKAGIKAGDVIVRAGDEKLTDRADLSHVLRSHREGGKIALGIMRDKHEQTISVDLPKRGAGDGSFWPNSDELRFNWDNFEEQLENYLEEIKPELELHGREMSLKAQAAAERARAAVDKAKPAADKAMRQAEESLRQAERELKQQEKRFKKQFDTMI